MASHQRQIERYPFQSAMAVLVKASRKSQSSIAADAGVDVRTLQRWLNGTVPPPVDKWVRVLSICNASPLTCLVIADRGPAGLIDTPTQAYVDMLLQQIVELVAEVAAAGEISLDPRAARRDAQLLHDSWQATYRKRQAFLDAQYAEYGGLPP